MAIIALYYSDLELKAEKSGMGLNSSFHVLDSVLTISSYPCFKNMYATPQFKADLIFLVNVPTPDLVIYYFELKLTAICLLRWSTDLLGDRNTHAIYYKHRFVCQQSTKTHYFSTIQFHGISHFPRICQKCSWD